MKWFRKRKEEKEKIKDFEIMKLNLSIFYATLYETDKESALIFCDMWNSIDELRNSFEESIKSNFTCEISEEMFKKFESDRNKTVELFSNIKINKNNNKQL